MAKHYIVNIKWDEPYPKQETHQVSASSAGRAAHLAEKKWKENRFRKREPEKITFNIIKL